MLKIITFVSLFICQKYVSSEYIFKGYDNSFIPTWWQSKVIYQVYIRSFKDSNGDGIGDLNGVTENVDYFKSIHVGILWLTPIFKSPQGDYSYGISNYKEIDPILGTMADFERLRDVYHKNGIKIIFDFVPNHTSDEHPWFINSVEKMEPYTNYYIWEDPLIDNNGNRLPPNNWLSVYNTGSAWEWNEKRQQYYYHVYQVNQPDLNYRNPVVVEEIKNAIIFWLERGVDGFRFDATNYLFERNDLADEPKNNETDYLHNDYDSLIHTSTRDQPETIDMVKIWRKLIDDYSNYTKFLMVDVYSDVKNTMKYYGNSTSPGAHFPINFNFITKFNKQSNAYDVDAIIKSWMLNMPDGCWPNWIFGNHDNSRIASRIHPSLVDGLHMMQLLLPGTPITYYADELGVQDTFIRWNQTLDPVGRNVGLLQYKQFSRDPERSPFPWDSSKNAGFTNGTPWLPINPEYWHENLQTLSKNKTHWQIYTQISYLTKTHTIVKGDLNVYLISKWVYGFSRSFYDHPTFFIVINFGSEIEEVNIKKFRKTLPDIMKVKISSINSNYSTGNFVKIKEIKLRPKAALVLSAWKPDSDKY